MAAQNALLRAIQAGIVDPKSLDEEQLAQLMDTPRPDFNIAPMQPNTMRVENGPDAGKMTNLDFQKTPMSTLQSMFQAAQGQPAQPQAQPRQLQVYGAGNGSTVQLAPETMQQPPQLDRTRAPVDIPGVGRAIYGKDGNAYVLGPDGQPVAKAILGYDQAGSMALNKADLERRQGEAQIAHTNAQTQAVEQQAEQGKTPQGYRPTAAGNLEAIPGGPADTKLQGQLNQDTATLQSTWGDLDRLAASANEIKEHPGLSHITGIAGKIWNVPGGPGANAEALLNTLKSQVAFGVLQNMRNNSKTGGALGNVSDKEGALLQSNLAALDKSQSTEEFQKNLQKIIDYTQAAKDRLANAYNLKYQNAARGTQPIAPSREQPAAQRPPQIGEIRKGYAYKGGDPASPSSWMKAQ